MEGMVTKRCRIQVSDPSKTNNTFQLHCALRFSLFPSESPIPKAKTSIPSKVLILFSRGVYPVFYRCRIYTLNQPYTLYPFGLETGPMSSSKIGGWSAQIGGSMSIRALAHMHMDSWCLTGSGYQNRQFSSLVLKSINQARQLELECSRLRSIMSPFAETMDWMTSSKFPGCVCSRLGVC